MGETTGTISNQNHWSKIRSWQAIAIGDFIDLKALSFGECRFSRVDKTDRQLIEQKSFSVGAWQ
ncbi:MAG: hypothetical protein GY866_11165 [Proteobacteria bacterium]|nr:hypothetical protein [Pseudomonadota bacterium]